MAWPSCSQAGRGGREFTLVSRASRVSAKSTGRRLSRGVGRLAQDVIGEHLGVGPDLERKPGEGDAVEHAIGVVGNEHDRPGWRGVAPGRVRIELDLTRSSLTAASKKVLAALHALLMLLVELLELALTADLLDRLDDRALESGWSAVE